MEQFKCLEQQSESRIQLLQDLQEFFRRKAEIELEYSRSLEKLADRFSSKIRSSREHQQFRWVFPSLQAEHSIIELALSQHYLFTCLVEYQSFVTLCF